MYDAVIFDLDGTLIDTETPALAAGLEAFAELDHPVEAEFLHQLVGKDLPSSAAIIQRHRPLIDFDLLNTLWRARFDARIAEGLPLKAGVADLLAVLTHPRAIATSSSRAGAWRKLALVGLETSFAHVITLDDVSLPKPAPEPFLLAAQRLGVDPARCVAFEDSETGAASAHAAGMCVVQVPDFLATDGRFARHVAPDILTGARLVGLID